MLGPLLRSRDRKCEYVRAAAVECSGAKEALLEFFFLSGLFITIVRLFGEVPRLLLIGSANCFRSVEGARGGIIS